MLAGTILKQMENTLKRSCISPKFWRKSETIHCFPFPDHIYNKIVVTNMKSITFISSSSEVSLTKGCSRRAGHVSRFWGTYSQFEQKSIKNLKSAHIIEKLVNGIRYCNFRITLLSNPFKKLLKLELILSGYLTGSWFFECKIS